MGLRWIGQAVACQQVLASSRCVKIEQIEPILPGEAPRRKQSLWGTRPGLLRGDWLRLEPQPAIIELARH